MSCDEPEQLNTVDLQSRQSERLCELLAAVVESNPFWQKKYAGADLDVASIRSLDDLRRIPLCTKQELVDDYYDGEAALIGYPFPPGDSWSKVYTPFEKQPQEVKDIFTYDPEKAKELLADAGYPDGFKTKITCTAATSDELSLVKEYWAAIDVELEFEVLEGGAWSGDLD